MGGSGGYPYTSSTGHVTDYHDYHDYVHDHVYGSSTVTNNLCYGNMPYYVLSGDFLDFVKTHFAIEIDLEEDPTVLENYNIL